MGARPPIETFVFSYNRGRFLRNLLESASAAAWTGPLTVIDDGSEDRATRRVLAQYARAGKARVIVPHHDGTAKYGGFWENMRIAFEELATERYVMFLQDDLQFVRRVRPSDTERCIELLSDPGLSPFLFPSFWWGARGQQDAYRQHYSYDGVRDFYRRVETGVQPGFSDVAMFDRERLEAAGWEAGRSETASNADAMARFGPMTLHPDPFIAFVPFAPRFRHGRAWRLAADPRRIPFPARLRLMADGEADRFVGRDRHQLPIAADHLRVARPIRHAMLRDSYWES